LIDHHGHRPIEVLPDRDADTLAAWLAQHPEVRIITRDRSGAYAEAARRGAPQATQCADRWHLWKNLGEAVEKTVIAHRGCLPDPISHHDTTPPEHIGPEHQHVRDEAKTTATPATPASPTLPTRQPNSESRLQTRSQHRYTDIHTLRGQGKGMRTIAKELGLDRKTVRRFLEAPSVDQLLAKTASRATVLDDYKPYLHQRWTEGNASVPQLVAEIRGQGYQGSARTVYRYLQPSQTERNPLPPTPAAPTIRAVTGWIMGNPDNLTDQDHQRLNTILARCPELQATRRHVGAFAHMIRDLRGDLLAEWIDRVHADNLPTLDSFITGLRHDLAAVTAGLTLPYNNGPTEGAVNRIIQAQHVRSRQLRHPP
jgi:transposase